MQFRICYNMSVAFHLISIEIINKYIYQDIICYIVFGNHISYFQNHVCLITSNINEYMLLTTKKHGSVVIVKFIAKLIYYS